VWAHELGFTSITVKPPKDIPEAQGAFLFKAARLQPHHLKASIVGDGRAETGPLK